jgi:hypothetical protein
MRSPQSRQLSSAQWTDDWAASNRGKHRKRTYVLECLSVLLLLIVGVSFVLFLAFPLNVGHDQQIPSRGYHQAGRRGAAEQQEGEPSEASSREDVALRLTKRPGVERYPVVGNPERLLLASHNRLMWYYLKSGGVKVLHEGQVRHVCGAQRPASGVAVTGTVNRGRARFAHWCTPRAYTMECFRATRWTTWAAPRRFGWCLGRTTGDRKRPGSTSFSWTSLQVHCHRAGVSTLNHAPVGAAVCPADLGWAMP